MRLRHLSSIAAASVLSLALAGCSGTPKTDASNPDQNNLTTTASAAPFSKTTDQPGQPEHKGWFSHDQAPPELTVPTGTILNVRLQSSISSATAAPGESFDAVLDEPLVVQGKTVAPRGAAVTGRVTEAKASGRLHDSGYLRLTLASVTINGKAVPVDTSSIFAKGANHNRRNAELIGGGAGAGTLIGALAGGGKGALIGGLVGAGAGTTGAYTTGKKDVAFGAERRLTFRLVQPVTAKS